MTILHSNNDNIAGGCNDDNIAPDSYSLAPGQIGCKYTIITIFSPSLVHTHYHILILRMSKPQKNLTNLLFCDFLSYLWVWSKSFAHLSMLFFSTPFHMNIISQNSRVNPKIWKILKIFAFFCSQF